MSPHTFFQKNKRRNIIQRFRILLIWLHVLVLYFGLAHADIEMPKASVDTAVADKIYIGENIITMDPEVATAEAVALAGEMILAVGLKENIMKLADQDTEIIDLGSKALLPGFIDAHGHLQSVGLNTEMINLSSPPVGDVTTVDELAAKLKNYIEEKKIPPGEWVMGFGYDDSLLSEQRHPNRKDLDRVSKDHPIVLMHVSGHIAAVNSKALVEKGISSETENPDGGVIQRFPNSNEPNGVVEEQAALDFILSTMNQLLAENTSAIIIKGIEAYAKYGVTTIQDGAATKEKIINIQKAALHGRLPADVVAFQLLGNDDLQSATTIQYEPEYQNGFRVGGMKLMLDGSPQGRTAFVTRPYENPPPGADKNYVAYPNRSQAVYDQQVQQLLNRKVPFITHANGDAAIDMMISGIEKTVSALPSVPDHRSVIIHAQLMRYDQIVKAKNLGLIPSFFSAHTFFWGDWHRKSFGRRIADNISPTGWALMNGLPFTIHNDSPVVPPDMMRLVWATVNRKTRSDSIIGPQQRLTPYQALYAITQGAAYQYFEENLKGSITPGKQADLVVLSVNPLTVQNEKIKDIQVEETISHGKTVFLINNNALD